MRCIILIACVAILGCGKEIPPAGQKSASLKKPSADPVVARRESDEAAAFNIDAACAAIEEALAATKKLAPVAGGNAKEALLDVAEMLDSAGATLADHNDAPPPIEKYRIAEAEQATERQKAVTDALDALHELRDAQGVLDSLAASVPTNLAKDLNAIRAQSNEAVSAVEDAIGNLGGKVPPEDDEPEPQP